MAFDTATIIYYVEQHPKYHNIVQIVIDAMDDGKLHSTASTLALAEVLVQPIKLGNQPLVQRYENILQNSTGFQLIPINQTIAKKSAELRATYNLKTPDALHVASAIVSGCDAFLTNDTGIKRVAEINVLILDELEI